MDSVLGIGMLALLAAGLMASSASEEGTPASLGLPNAFFAMDTGTKDTAHQTAEAQAEMLAELGYDGIGYTGFANLPELLRQLDARDLRLFNIYTALRVNPDGSSYDEGLEPALPLFDGRDVVLWLTLTSDHWEPSDTAGDEQAVEVLRALAGKAASAGVRIALYPHVNSWLERVEDGVRVAEKVARENVGTSFNLYHWLRTDDPVNLRAVMTKAMPHLYFVTINGTNNEGSIETLDRCSFDMRGFLATLKDLGYDGPIGLQGYGIGGDVHANLARSMGAWRTLAGAPRRP